MDKQRITAITIESSKEYSQIDKVYLDQEEIERMSKI
jgi:hypothetical protein